MRIASLFFAIAIALSWLPPAHARGIVQPPFVRHWTCFTDDGAYVVAVKNGIVYYRSNNGVGAVTLSTGQRRWTALSGQRNLDAKFVGKTLFVLVPETKTVHAIAAETGKVRELARLPNSVEKLGADTNNLYVLDGAAQLTALSQATGKILWSRTLVASVRNAMLQLAVTNGAVYVGIDDVGEFGVDPITGKTLWNRRCDYASLYIPRVIGRDVITHFDSLRRINVRTGKSIWKRTDKEEHGEGVFGDIVLGYKGKTLTGYASSDGHALWKLSTDFGGSGFSGIDEPDFVTDTGEILLSGNKVVCISRSGKLLWQKQAPITGTPVYADQNYIVTTDILRILCYKRDALPPLPKAAGAQKALAERLASQLELIDDAERQQLNKLKPYSFAPFFKKYMEWVRAYDALTKNGDKDELRSYGYYHLIMEVQPLLHSLCEKRDTALVLNAWERIGEKSSWRDELESVLQRKGDPAGYIPILVKNLRQTPLEKRQSSVALAAVAYSSHTEAVALMIEALNDSKAAHSWRTQAFRHLAKTGGEAGIAAVRGARAKRKERKPWFESIDLAKLDKREIEAVKQDNLGRTWMLFRSPVFGNYSDLFVVEKKGETWGRPIFTGVWTGRTFRTEAPKDFRGIPLSKLVQSEWIQIFPGDASLQADQDSDGLTDLVEARLGLNPNQADTDMDGISDAVDPCPNVAPQILGDTEKIIAACIEAHFFEQEWGTPAILSVEGVKPLELYGYADMLLWGSQPTLNKLYGGGVNLINFSSPEDRRKDKGPFIVYSKDRQRARTIISRYSGGLNGEGVEVFLQKIGDDWFVVDIQGRWVS